MAKAFKKIISKSSNGANIDTNIAQRFINNATGDFELAESQNKQKTQIAKQRGRPKVSAEEKIQVALYLTKSQNEHISSTASELGMSKNNYILYMLFKKENFFSNADIEELLVRARAEGVGLKEYLKNIWKPLLIALGIIILLTMIICFI